MNMALKETHNFYVWHQKEEENQSEEFIRNQPITTIVSTKES